MGFAQKMSFLGLSALFILGLGILTIEALGDGGTLTAAESVREGLVALGNTIADRFP